MTGEKNRAALLQEAIRLKRLAARSRSADLPVRPAERPARLGELQRSLWVLHQVAPASPAYNLVGAYRAPSGGLDFERLQSALRAIVARHRLLRSSFRAQGSRVLQIVHDDLDVEVDARTADASESIDAVAVAAARLPFDLGTPPLIRLHVVGRDGAPEQLVVLVLHHILADERSLGMLWGEFARAYGGGTLDRDEPPAAQFDDYVDWLARRDDDRGAAVAFWRERLRPLPDDLALPFETVTTTRAGAAPTPSGRLLTRGADEALRDRVRAFATSIAATPFAVYAFAFQLVLQRYTEGRRVAFATPASVRAHPAAGAMLGYFLNPVVVCTTIDEDRSIEEAAKAFGQELRELLARATVPFDVLAEQLAPPRQPDRHPIFQAMFVHQETRHPTALGDVALEPVALDLGESKFDVTLFAAEGERSLEFAVEFRTDRFAACWMERLLDHYETVLEHLVGGGEREPADRIADVPTFGRDEFEWLDVTARGPVPTAAADDDELLPERILARLRSAPNEPAVTCGDERWDGAQLARVGLALAAELRAAGIAAGDHVGLYVDRSPFMVAAVLGCHWAGAAYVPLDPAYPSRRNHDVLEDAAVAAVVTTRARRDELPAVERCGVVVVAEDLALDAEEPGPLVDVGAAEAAAPERAAYLLYTSGSTGRPKGVVVSHGNLAASTAARLQTYEIAPRRFLLLPSLAFDSSVAGLFWTLAAGGELVLPTRDEAQDPQRLAALVERARVTSLLCVPSLYAHLLRSSAAQLQTLEVAIVAGEACSSLLVAEHYERLPAAKLYNEYGPTEATVWASVHDVEPGDATRPVAIGRPIPGVRVDVLDARGRPVPAGIPGQAWVAGPTVAQGYWQRPEQTDERFVTRAVGHREPQRRYATGDRVAWSLDGRLLFLGREDEQIKLRGFRIEPGEVEAVLVDDAAVESAAVVAHGAGGDARLVAFVAFGDDVVDRQHDEILARLRDALGVRLPAFMVPSRVVPLSALPTLPNGKVDRPALRRLELEPETATRGTDARVPIGREQALLSLWEGLLGRFGIRVDDNFFELGGHSLLAVEMTVAIERDFGVSLTAADVFEHPTVEGLARRIEQRRDPQAPTYAHLFPLQPRGDGAPIAFCVPHFFSAMFAERFRGERPVYGLRGVSLRAEGNLGRWRSMVELGAQLADEVVQRFPDQPVFVAGYSFGASMAFELVRQLEQRGVPVRALYLIAPMPLDFARFGPFRMQLDGLRQPVGELSFGSRWMAWWRTNHPLTRRPYRRLWLRVGVRGWRHVLCAIGRVRRALGMPLTPRILHADVRIDRFRLHSRYAPGTVATPTVVFNANEPATDAAATWRPHFTGAYTVVPTPDPHLDDESIAAAKAVILRHLEELDDGDGD